MIKSQTVAETVNATKIRDSDDRSGGEVTKSPPSEPVAPSRMRASKSADECGDGAHVGARYGNAGIVIASATTATLSVNQNQYRRIA
jgi:hypothetical protein